MVSAKGIAAELRGRERCFFRYRQAMDVSKAALASPRCWSGAAFPTGEFCPGEYAVGLRTWLAWLASGGCKSAVVLLGTIAWAVIALVVSLSAGLAAHALQDKPASLPDVSLQQMRSLVQKQLDLIQAKKAEELRQHFTPRLRERITPELLQEVQPRLAKVSVEELVAEIRQTEKNGRHLVIVRMRSGRLLTVFVWHQESWLADTLWFR